MGVDLVLSPRQHFTELVEAGFERLKIQTYPAVQTYLVDLLEYYLDARNLHPNAEVTLAEEWLRAGELPPVEKAETLKQLGDRALYISGFFSDSFQRKIIDVDYYAEMGGAAYGTLASCVREDTRAQIYRVFSVRFVEFADVLTFISQKSLVQNNESLLRLYERYLKTGSEMARDQLIEKGVLTLPPEQAKKARQD